ncbi:F-box and leucine-rich repeat protein 4 [Basidiobolus ranarum]|uniref:F-box and leucine-rich repeat protein 4 n=1 Tax=Basidiobolus ranarum TaxID=34480 RepID=A0ABR2X4L3_9FUNG
MQDISLQVSQFSPEIWSQIISYLQNDTYQLYSCCLVSRTWYALAMPALWSSPQFTTQMDFLSFEKAIVSNPLLPTLVNRFDLTGYAPQIVVKHLCLLEALPSLRSLHLPLVLENSSISLDCLEHMSHLEEIHDLNIELSTRGLTQLISVLNSSKCLRKVGLVFKAPQLGNGPIDSSTLSSIPMLPNIESLNVTFGVEFDVQILELLLSRLPKLARFAINSRYTPKYIVRILAEHCQGITSLSLGTFSGLGDELLDEFCKDLEVNYAGQLKEFSMYFFNDWPIYSERFTRNLFKSFYNLEKLKLSGVRLNNNIVQALTESLSSKLQSLELSCISYRNLFTYEVLDDFLVKVGPRLKNLALMGAFLPSHIGSSIAKRCPILERLSLSCTNVNDDSITAIAHGCGRKLRQLDVGETDITNDGLTSIFQNCSKLQDLGFAKLSSCPEFDENIGSFLSQHGHQLQRLDLSFLPTKETTLMELAKFAKELRELTFTDQPGIGDDAVSNVIQSCRKLNRLSVTRYSRTAQSISNDMLDRIDQHYIRIDDSQRDSKRS